MGFVENKENIEHKADYPLTQTTSNCEAKCMKQSLHYVKGSMSMFAVTAIKMHNILLHILDRTDREAQQLHCSVIMLLL